MATIFITGATDGIGYALAQFYAARGDRLVLLGKRPLAALDGAFFTEQNYVQADLSLPDVADRVTDFLKAQHIAALDVVIHNAGLGYYGPVEAQSSDNINDLVAVNLRAPVVLTYALLPYLKQARGKLVFISSVASALPVADYAVYGATKAAIDAFAHNLRIELAPDVDVKLIHPGATRTGMHRKSGVPDGHLKTEKYPLPDKVASQIASVIDSSRKQRAIGLPNQMMRWAGIHAAGLIDLAMKGRAAR